MKKLAPLAAAAFLLPLAACNNSPSDRLADNVQNAADMRADQLENRANEMEAQADLLANRADDVRDTGEQRADAIKAADQNVQAMSPEQRQAVIANQAPAVR